MITTTTLFAAVSVVPMINIPVSNRSEFITSGGPISIGEYTYDPQSASISKDERVELIDADDFLHDLLAEHDLEGELPEARRWLAKELYDGAQPTLAALRLKKGLTQSQLASLVKQPQSSISRLESGSESPSIDRAAKLAETLGVSLDQFYSALNHSREIGKRNG